jgi:hypothetical protein
MVGVGMTLYGRAALRVASIGMRRLRTDPGTVLVAAHLSDADVPMLAGMMWRNRLWTTDALRPGFVVRNDMLVPGFLAGYPPGLPLWLRRALFPVGIGAIMHRHLVCLPVRFSDRLRVVEALRDVPAVPLAEALPEGRREALLRRARAAGRPAPVLAGDVLDGTYADLLWEVADQVELDSPALEAVWRRRRAASAEDLQLAADHVRRGGSLILFPHGFPSADGAIGPLDARVARFVRWMRPSAIQPIGLAYDPLTRGRERAFVAAGTVVHDALSRERGGAELLAAMRGATPLTAGHVVAHETVRRGVAPGIAEATAALVAALGLARRRGRPVERALEDRDRAARRVREAVAAATRMGPAHPAVVRTARTYATALERAT